LSSCLRRFEFPYQHNRKERKACSSTSSDKTLKNKLEKKDRRKNRVFKLERKNIKFPIWRKKVDSSVFNDRAITIPKSFVGFWNVAKFYKGVTGAKDPRSSVEIYFEN